MRRAFQASFISWRFYVFIALISLLILGLIGRMFYLTIFNHKFLKSQGDQRVLRFNNTPGFRGMILDRNGLPLAISAVVYSAWVNPKQVVAGTLPVKQLSEILKLDSREIIKKTQPSKRQFVYLKRGLSPDQSKQIKQLQVPGIYLQESYKRFYPQGEITAHVLGRTNVDDRGIEGMELAFDQQLAGVPGREVVIRDRLGRIISDVKTIQTQKRGKDITLSIDSRLQYLAYHELLAGVQKNKAASGTAIVMDAKTGEILAMVNQPSFNPNRKIPQDLSVLRNRAVTDVFEPGSVMKGFSVARIIDSGKYTPDSIVDTTPGWWRIGRNIVRDDERKDRLTVTQVLQYSSNVGVSKLVLSLPPEPLWQLLHRAGFGQSTNSGFPGERTGVLPYRKDWPPFALATLSFGYGVSVTALQLIDAYSIFANHGIKMPVSLIKIDKIPQGVRVLSQKTADTMLAMLENVVINKDGTGLLARIPGYTVAGKTGTAHIAIPGGYAKSRYIASFVGIAPVSNPRFIVLVVIHDPQGKSYYASLVAAPIFQKIMAGALRILNIPPDDPTSLPLPLVTNNGEPSQK